MTSFFAKMKPLISATAGGCVGGITVYYMLGDRADFTGHKDFPHVVTASSPHDYEKWDPNWDRRDPRSLVKPLKGTDDPTLQNTYNEKVQKHKSKAVRNIFLIRHGQYNLNGNNDKERTLTKLGEHQAVLTGERLKELGYPYDKLVQSTMTRASQTAGFISKFLPEVPTESCSMIEEGAPCKPEPSSYRWKPDLYQFYEDGARIEAAFRKYIHRAPPEQEHDSYEIFVCHGNVIRYFICRALQLPPNAWLRFSINHASITWLSINPSGRVMLRVYSDTGHMPPNAITTS